jgi:GNAT superfamily N-acetyltransferase
VAEAPLRKIEMFRSDLDNIPEYGLPPEFYVKLFKPGCEKTWIDIQTEADKRNVFDMDRFRNAFINDYESLAKRQYFLFTRQSQPIGTATAWYANNKPDGNCGLVHWVGILPEFQGRGLAKPLLTIVLTRMKQLGHRSASLRTATIRLPAINLYLKFGFVPVVSRSEEKEYWKEVKNALERKNLDASAIKLDD